MDDLNSGSFILSLATTVNNQGSTVPTTVTISTITAPIAPNAGGGIGTQNTGTALDSSNLFKTNSAGSPTSTPVEASSTPGTGATPVSRDSSTAQRSTTVLLITTIPAQTTTYAGPNGGSATFTIPAEVVTEAAVVPFTLQPSSNKGLSNGAVAGIAIGLFALGAILGAAIIGLLLRKKRPSHKISEPYVGPAAPRQTEKSVVASSVGPVNAIDSYLPQPAADDDITGDFSKIRDNIKNHAQNYYHISPVDGAMMDENEFNLCANGAGISSRKLQDMFLNPDTRISAIRLYLAWSILSRVEGSGQTNSSLLPAEVARFAPVLAGLDSSKSGLVVLAGKWKAISGTLLQSHLASLNQGQIIDDFTSRSIQAIIAEADSVLVPFIISSSDEKRRRNMESILRRSAQFSFLLFSQPSTWNFDWHSASKQGRVVVFPALVQTVTDEGALQRPPKILTNAELK